jgi:hypothetical protein
MDSKTLLVFMGMAGVLVGVGLITYFIIDLFWKLLSPKRRKKPEEKPQVPLGEGEFSPQTQELFRELREAVSSITLSLDGTENRLSEYLLQIRTSLRQGQGTPELSLNQRPLLEQATHTLSDLRLQRIIPTMTPNLRYLENSPANPGVAPPQMKVSEPPEPEPPRKSRFERKEIL